MPGDDKREVSRAWRLEALASFILFQSAFQFWMLWRRFSSRFCGGGNWSSIAFRAMRRLVRSEVASFRAEVLVFLAGAE